MEDDERPICQVIRDARQRLGLSQRKLADQLAAESGNDAISREHVSRWERGTRIPSRYWRKPLSQVLQLDLEALETAALWAEVRRADEWLEENS